MTLNEVKVNNKIGIFWAWISVGCFMKP